jgi:hypothetical protein
VKWPQFSPVAFTVAYCCAYSLAFALNLPLFIYYPLHGNFSWGRQVLNEVGPPILWYGFVADAIIIGAVASICIPDRPANKVINLVWLFPVAAMAICIYLLRRLFQ